MTQRSSATPTGPEQDLELLSAYLDQQLSSAERVNLERRFAAEPQLQRELDELRATVAALRNLEPERPPRSFTLDPAQVARPRRFFPLSWAMQMGSGLAGLALVLLATVQLLGTGAIPAFQSGGSASAPAELPAPMAAESAPMSAAEAAPTVAAAAPAAGMSAAATEAPAATAAPAAEMSGPASAGVTEATGANDSAATGAEGEMRPPSADQMDPADIQSSESSSPNTQAPYLDPGQRMSTQPAPPTPGVNPGITFALGALLIVLAVGWNVASRRRV
jgi:anti-sigma factor RsiW